MKPWIEIRRNSDGLIRKFRDDFDWDGDFIWEGGNYACDCNRTLFFERAGGNEPAWDAYGCGDSAYSVRITDDAGSVLYQDESWEVAPSNA